jgi:hypothetical protein
MKRMYRLRKKQDTQLGREQATAVLTFEVNDQPLEHKKHRDPVLKPFGTT